MSVAAWSTPEDGVDPRPRSDVDATFLALRPELLAVAQSRLRSPADAEDVLQDAWIRWREHHAEVESPRAWLHVVTRNLCIDRARVSAARHEVLMDGQLDAAERGHAVEPPDRDVLAEHLAVLLSTLTPLERAVFVLRECFEWRHGHVARLLGRREEAVRQVAHRARRRLDHPPLGEPVPERDVARAVDAYLVAHATGEVMPLLLALAPEVLLPGPVAASARPVHEVVGALVVRRDEVLLGRRRPNLLWYPDVWDLPGSHVRATERPLNCMLRVSRDELGITPTRPQLVTTVADADWVLHVYRVDAWDGGIRNAKPEAHDELAFVDEGRARHLRLADRRLLDLFAHAGPVR